MLSKVLERDFLSLDRDLFGFYANKSVVVTGATGFVGSLLVKYFLLANEHYGLGVTVNAFARNVAKAQQMFEQYDQTGSLAITQMSLPEDDLSQVECDVDVIFHTAAITTSRVMVGRPVDVIDVSVSGTRGALDLASKTGARMVYLSSMEVYGTMPHGVIADETKLGAIDNLLPRSGYPESKRLCECLCVSHKKQYGTDVRIARLAQTFGAGIARNEGRSFAQFAKCALSGRDIVLRTRGLSDSNSVYSSDAVAALLLIASQGASGEVYNVVNEGSHTTVRELANLVADVLSGGSSSVVIDFDENNSSGFAPDVKLVMSSRKIKSLGWKALVSLPDCYRRLADYMVEQGMLDN